MKKRILPMRCVLGFRSWSFRTLLSLTTTITLLPQSAFAFNRENPWWFQGDLEAGYQEIDPNVANELKKGGFLLGGRGLFEYRTLSWGAFGVGLGLQQTWQDGETDVRIQKYTLRSVIVDGSYLYPFLNDFFWVGWLVRNQVGEGARFDFFGDIDSTQTLVTTGPQIRFNFEAKGWGKNQWDWVLGASALKAVNSESRSIINFPVYVGITFPLDIARSKVSDSAAPVATRFEDSGRFSIEMRTLRFALDSAELSERAKKFLNQFAQALIKHDKTWKKVVITGHTDVTGSRAHNQALSHRRAESIRRELIRQGIPSERMRVSGHASYRALPNIETDSALNRRAEITLEDIENGDLLMRDLNAIPGEE